MKLRIWGFFKVLIPMVIFVFVKNFYKVPILAIFDEIWTEYSGRFWAKISSETARIGIL